MRNITKASRELGVSRTKVYKEIKTLKIQSVKNGKNNLISDEDFYRIKDHIEAENEQQGNTSKRIKDVLERDRSMINGNLSDREYVDLKERISFLEKQLNIKDDQIQEKDFQINGLIQSTFKFYKTLKSGDEYVDVEENQKKNSWISKLFRKKA